MPKSDRLQFQIPVQLAPGTDSRETLARVKQISGWLGDTNINPEVSDHIGYVADGGPRFILSLNPPLPASNIAYFVVTLKPKSDIDAVLARTRSYFAQAHGDVRAEPVSRSVRPSQGLPFIASAVRMRRYCWGRVQNRSSAAQAARHHQRQERLGYARWPHRRTGRPDRARRAGVTTEDIAGGLDVRYSGRSISVIRDGDTSVPIVLRSIVSERRSTADVGATLIYPTNGGPAVTLAQVADVSLASEPSVIQRRNLIRTITVQGQNTSYTAQEIINRPAPSVAAWTCPRATRLNLAARSRKPPNRTPRCRPTCPSHFWRC